MKVSKICLLAVIFYLLGGVNLSAQTTKAGLMEKTVIDFYRTNYGNTRYGLAPRSGSVLGRLSGKEYVSSDLDLDPFIGSMRLTSSKL